MTPDRDGGGLTWTVAAGTHQGGLAPGQGEEQRPGRPGTQARTEAGPLTQGRASEGEVREGSEMWRKGGQQDSVIGWGAGGGSRIPRHAVIPQGRGRG